MMVVVGNHESRGRFSLSWKIPAAIKVGRSISFYVSKISGHGSGTIININLGEPKEVQAISPRFLWFFFPAIFYLFGKIMGNRWGLFLKNLLADCRNRWEYHLHILRHEPISTVLLLLCTWGSPSGAPNDPRCDEKPWTLPIWSVGLMPSSIPWSWHCYCQIIGKY